MSGVMKSAIVPCWHKLAPRTIHQGPLSEDRQARPHAGRLQCASTAGPLQLPRMASASRAKTCGSQLRPGVVFAGTCKHMQGVTARPIYICNCPTACTPAQNTMHSPTEKGQEGDPERQHLLGPGHGGLPVVGVARQAAPRGGVADGQVGRAAVLVVIAARRVLQHTSIHC